MLSVFPTELKACAKCTTRCRPFDNALRQDVFDTASFKGDQSDFLLSFFKLDVHLGG